MPRPKRNIHFPESWVSDIQEWLNLEATCIEMMKRYNDAETADIIESQNCRADSVMKFLCRELGLTGHPNMEYIESEYSYYSCRYRSDRYGNGYVNDVKPEYRKGENNG